MPLDRFRPDIDGFLASSVEAHRWNGGLYALPWFVDVGMLYRRTDLVPDPPGDLDALAKLARRGMSRGPAYGFVWQGARYEGLVTVFLEHLGAFGGAIIDEQGRVVVDSDAAVSALTFMRDAIGSERDCAGGRADLAGGADALRVSERPSRVHAQLALRLRPGERPRAVGGRRPRRRRRLCPAAGGAPTAALGGSALAINAFSEQPEEAYRLIEFLLRPEQMLERARDGRPVSAAGRLYKTPQLAAALELPLQDVAAILDHAVPQTGDAGLQSALRAASGVAAPGPHTSAGAARRRSRMPPSGCARCWRASSSRRHEVDQPSTGQRRSARRAHRLATGGTRAGGHRVGRAPPDGLDAVGVVARARPAHAVARTALRRPRQLLGGAARPPDLGRGRAHGILRRGQRRAGIGRRPAARAHAGPACRSFVVLVRTIVLLPWAIPTVVAALIWRFMFESPGGLATAWPSSSG